MLTSNQGEPNEPIGEQIDIKSSQTLHKQQEIEHFISLKIDQAVKNITTVLITTFQIEIDKLMNDNRKLSKQIAELKSVVQTQKTTRESSPDTVDGAANQNKRPNIKSNVKEDRKNDMYKKDQNRTIEKSLNSVAAPKKGAKENIDISPNKQSLNHVATNIIDEQTQDDFRTVVRRHKRKSNLRVTHGTATDTTLRGAIPYAHLHAYGLDPITTTTDIITHLNSKGITNPKVQKVKSKHPDEYASYKISVPSNLLNEVKKPELWPTGVKVNRFLERLQNKLTQVT